MMSDRKNDLREAAARRPQSTFGITVWLVMWLAAGWLAADEPAPSGYRTYPLVHRQAAEVAPQLRELLTGDAEVIVDTHMNRLLVRGADQAGPVVEALVRALDQPNTEPTRPAAERQVRGYRVGATQLDALRDQLVQLYGDRPDVRIAADRRTSQLIVVAPPDVHQQIEQQLGQNDRRETTQQRISIPNVEPQAEIIHPLANVSWREFEDALERIWGRMLESTTHRNGELAQLQLVAVDGSQTEITVDRRSNLITARVPRRTAAAWRQLIAALDSPRSPQGTTTAVTPLYQADPRQIRKVVSLLEQLSRHAAPGAMDPLLQLAPPIRFSCLGRAIDFAHLPTRAS